MDQAEDLMVNSPALVGELRMIHMCSQSDGACVVIFASEEKARQLGIQPAWVKDHITAHREEMFCIFGREPYKTSMRYCAEKLFARNNIKDPRKEIDVFEMYDPSSWWGSDWLREFLLLEGDEHLKMIENSDIAFDGSFPINPSGGVIGSNPIGATALVRVAEAALQVMGKAGEHQLPKPINQALASGFGGTMWTVLMLLTKQPPV
jgi:acetyl-CoA C-acetyltransferase